ncbi:MAG: flagellar biosynthesis protein FlhF [Gammaproteobacteria bacterium]|nr:flagellar biosynthesis protein FlhF [Gammaproteobacteria bacterium]
MKIKRFLGTDIRQAMRKVRESLGEDAVILSNKRVNGGVEVIAAVDYDESAIYDQQPGVENATSQNSARGQNQEPVKPKVVWSQEPTLLEMKGELRSMRGLLETQLANLTAVDFEVKHPLQHQMQQRMSKLGFGKALSSQLIEKLPNEGNIEDLWRRMLGKLAINVKVTDDDILTNGGVIALIGPTGVGKTTTIAKLAARFALRFGNRSVALISTDSYRIGAHEQLKAYARILDVPFKFVNTRAGLDDALAAFSDRRLVLIDTAGMSQRDMRLSKHLELLGYDRAEVATYLVVSTTSRLSGLNDVVATYKKFNVKGCILTKIDESTCLGSALDVVIRHNLPVAYVSDGQRVPEDLQPARSHTLVSRSVVIMQDNADLLEDGIPMHSAGEAGG